MQKRTARLLWVLTAVVFPSPAWGVNRPSPAVGPQLQAAPSPAATRLAWRVILPLRTVDTIQSYHLLDGIIYAAASSGHVHAIRAESGQLLWTRPLLEPGEVFYPPFVHYSPEFYGVGFTLARHVLLLDPQTGSEFKRIRLETGSAAAAASSADSIFSAETSRSVRAYNLTDNYPRWEVMTDGPMVVAPVFLNDLQTVFVADMSGRIAMVWATDREVVYVGKLGGEPQGWIGMDHRHFYISTSDNALNCINKITGAAEWQYRLPAKPIGGPVLLNGSIYQALSGGGVQQIRIERDRPNWLAEDAIKFLADWNGHPVLLYRDGRIAVVDPMNGTPTTGIAEQASSGLTNTVNHALLLTTNKGELRCLLPADASPAGLATFRPPTTQPTTQPSDPPALVRVDEEEEVGSVWIRSSGQQSTGSGISGGSGRQGRVSERSSRGGGRSRGDRSAGRGSGRSGRGESGRSGRGSDRGSRSGGRGSRNR